MACALRLGFELYFIVKLGCKLSFDRGPISVYPPPTPLTVPTMSSSATGEIPSSGGSTTESLEQNTVMVVLGASGDLAKKKVSISSDRSTAVKLCSLRLVAKFERRASMTNPDASDRKAGCRAVACSRWHTEHRVIKIKSR